MIELKIPEVGESVQEALLAQWLKRDGESVRKDDVLFVIETDKVTLEISAPADGVLKILVPEGQTVKVGAVVGQIEEAAAEISAETVRKPPEPAGKSPAEESKTPGPEAPRPAPPERRAPEPSPPPRAQEAAAPDQKNRRPPSRSSPHRSALWRKKRELTFPPLAPTGPGGRITEGDVLLFVEQHAPKNRPRRPQSGNTPVPYPPPEEGRTPCPRRNYP